MEQPNEQYFWEEFTIYSHLMDGFTITDLLKVMFPEEFALNLAWHEQEWNSIQNRIERQLTLERKKTILFAELEALEQYFEEDEFREMFEDLGQTPLNNLREKVKDISPKIQKTSRWLELSPDEKRMFSTMEKLPNDLFGKDLNPKVLYKNLLKHPIRKPLSKLLEYSDKKNQKTKRKTFRTLLLNFSGDIFNDYFQIELNKKLQEELKKILPANEYQLAHNEELEDNQSKNKEFTTSRQCLALHYLFRAAGVNNVDTTQKASFAQFLLSKELNATYIANTNIYKRLKNPLRENNKKLEEDLVFIQKYFQGLGLEDVVKQIQKEINECR